MDFFNQTVQRSQLFRKTDVEFEQMDYDIDRELQFQDFLSAFDGVEVEDAPDYL